VIDRFVDVLTSLDKRLSAIEDILPTLCDKVSKIEGVVANPDGYVTFSGCVNTTKDQIKSAMSAGTLMSMDHLKMEVQFSQAVFMGVRLAKNPELADTLSDAAVAQLNKILHEAQRALDLIDAVERREKESIKSLNKAWDKVQELVSSSIAKEINEEKESLRSAANAENNRVLDSVEELIKERKRVEKAIEGLELVLSEARTERSEIRRETRAKGRTKSVASIRR